ncbi:hypothetical protein I302_101499 [Kwoniella bestiolae CBS 10118]|uniref:Uncharacterized protein n=1 Tax=Kwoniella bestiolae CBS 10118 TaxID=1296100 RepID=A0A1B9GCE3_9TREE|nr:hypothetical protein I302_00182 [Kwoniella bestiolae CBS 10118]OCF28693.1 hypothetical protein I302_00182 [Kwoniella bestiolae CBS 10118]
MSFISNYLPLSVPVTLSALSLGLIPLLVLHFRSYLSPSHRPSANALPSSFYPAVTTHGRHLPITAKNGFSYAVLYLGVDVDSMESGKLNLPFRIFKWSGNPLTKLIGLRSKPYLSHGDHSLRSKLEQLLCTSKYGIGREEIGRVWLLTLPSLAGWEGPNPLTQWYVYRPAREEGEVGELLCVILEVHSSFDESHAYVLKPNSEYRQEPIKGYDLAFRIPRQFHVSPFNSRDGFYRVDLINPFPHSDLEHYRTNPPQFKTCIKLYTTDDQIKFVAVLTSGPSPPVALEPRNVLLLLRTISKWPFTLMSVNARTFYQAYKLHYLKKLALFPRPEHHTTGSEGIMNPPQKGEGRDIGQGLQRQGISWVEVRSREVVQRWARQRVEDTGIGLEIKMTNGREDLVIPAKSEVSNGNGHVNGHANSHLNGQSSRKTDGHTNSNLVVTTSDPLFFANLLVSPSPHHSLIMFSEQLTSVSSPQLFLDFFSPPLPTGSDSDSGETEIPVDRLTRLTRNRRKSYFTYLYSHSTYPPLPSIPPLFDPPPHFVEHPSEEISLKDKLTVARIVFWHTFSEYFEYRLFDTLRARFVEGSEPWKIWERSMKSYFWGRDVGRVQGREEERKMGTYFHS